MSFLQSIILGIIEGVTEFLPISSTGHLVLASDLMKISQTEFVKSFEISIQLGAILSVVVLYFKSFVSDFEALKRIIVAFLPTAVLGVILYKIVKTFLLGNDKIIVYSLLVGGLILVLFEYFYKEKEEGASKISEITLKQSFTIGIFQSLAMIPGVSRSAATIVGGLILGIKRKTIVEFSFLLAVPTMLAATALDLLKSYKNFSSNDFGILSVGFLVSFFVAILSIKFLLSFIKKHTFLPFGVYRIILAIIFLFWIM